MVRAATVVPLVFLAVLPGCATQDTDGFVYSAPGTESSDAEVDGASSATDATIAMMVDASTAGSGGHDASSVTHTPRQPVGSSDSGTTSSSLDASSGAGTSDAVATGSEVDAAPETGGASTQEPTWTFCEVTDPETGENARPAYCFCPGGSPCCFNYQATEGPSAPSIVECGCVDPLIDAGWPYDCIEGAGVGCPNSEPWWGDAG
jgi:hypothetical protein